MNTYKIIYCKHQQTNKKVNQDRLVSWLSGEYPLYFQVQ
jgi:hypothetical protein